MVTERRSDGQTDRQTDAASPPLLLPVGRALPSQVDEFANALPLKASVCCLCLAVGDFRCSVSSCFYRAKHIYSLSCASVPSYPLGIASSPLVLSCLSRRHASCYTPGCRHRHRRRLASTSRNNIYPPVCFLCSRSTPARDAPSRERFSPRRATYDALDYRGEYQHHHPECSRRVSSFFHRCFAGPRAPRTAHLVSPRVYSACRRAPVSPIRHVAFFFLLFIDSIPCIHTLRSVNPSFTSFARFLSKSQREKR